jgi:membrane associated rhomboid family serine protease
MFAQGDDARQTPMRSPRWPATTAILAVSVIAFLLQKLAEHSQPAFPLDGYFALSVEGLRHGFIWQLLTFQFMHGGWLHLFLNCWAIYVFGRPVEDALAAGPFLRLYLLSGIVGGLMQMIGALLMENHFGGAVVGASAGALGLVAAFAALFPEQRLLMLLFFVIPIAMRARTLLWISVALSVLGMLIPYGEIAKAADQAGPIADYLISRLVLPYATIAHTAHLGGILTGLFLSRRIAAQYATITEVPVPPVIR